eukprot:s5540_g2.t1
MLALHGGFEPRLVHPLDSAPLARSVSRRPCSRPSAWLCEACAAVAIAAARPSSTAASGKRHSTRYKVCLRVSAEELGLTPAVERAVRLIGPDEDLLITGETGACVQRDGDSFVLKEEGLSGIAPGSAGHVALAETLPTSDLAPAQLLSWVRQAVQALQDGGTLLLTSFWGPSGPLQPLLTLPELRLEVGL